MSDVTAVTLRDHVLGSADPIVQTQVRGWESPSNRLLAGLFSVGYTLSVPELPFDPVTPRRGTATPLWVRRGGDLVVGVPAPPVGLGHAIAAVAEGDDAVEDLWDRAAQLSSTLDPTCAAQLAASMVHPPLDVAWLRSTPDGLFRHQVACACVLASLPHGWPKTRPIFEALLFGPVDWTSSAAIVALGQLAQRDASAAHEALALLSDTVADLLPHPAEPRFVPLSRVLKALPCVAPAQIDALDSWRNAFIHDPASDEEDSLTAPAVAPRSDRRPLLLGPVLLVVGLLLATLLRRCTSLH